MKNKFLMAPHKNVNFVLAHKEEYLQDCLALSRYTNNDPNYDKAKENFLEGFDYILNNKDVENNYEVVLKLHDILMKGLQEDINSTLSDQQISELEAIINQPAKANSEIAIDSFLYILDKRLFKDGDVRCALFFANKVIIDNGCGYINIPDYYDDKFRQYLKSYKEHPSDEFKMWIYNYCLCGPKNQY